MAVGSDTGNEKTPVRIKKYANRRLYNTATSSYVTLDYLAQMVREGLDFTGEDAKTGEDITRSVLTQIIVEEESKGQNMLPINFLRQHVLPFGFFLDDNLGQDGTGDILTGFRVFDGEIQSLADHLCQIVQGHIRTGCGIVETPVGIFLNPNWCLLVARVAADSHRILSFFRAF